MSTQKLGDELMKVPKLDTKGTNWLIYSDRFQISVRARGLSSHIDGSETAPTDPIASRATAVAAAITKARADGDDEEEAARLAATGAKLSADEEKLDKEWRKELKTWEQEDAIVTQQLVATIPDSLYMRHRDRKTARLLWVAVRDSFQNRSRMVAVDLQRKLQAERFAEKGDLQAHFDNLCRMREELAALGKTLDEDDFYAIIMVSLPPSFDSLISSINGTSSVTGQTLLPDDLMTSILEDYD